MSNQKLQQLLKKEMTRKEFLGWGLFAIASIMGIAGLIDRILSHAATQTADKEVEDGVITGGAAAVLSSTAASGGQAVKFSQATTPPTTGFDVGSSYQGNGNLDPFEATVGAVFESHRTYFGPTDQASAASMIKTDIADGRKCSSMSFKLPYSWAQMASGSGDTWARNLLTTLQTANSGGHRVRIAFHHEPENDTGTNDGGTDAGRDAWKAMQARLAPIFDVPNFQFVCILMGYHSFSYGGASADDVARWNLDACIPKIAAVKGVGFDIYQKKDVDGVTKWGDMSKYYTAIGTWADTNNKAWGISETGIAATAFSTWSSSGLTWMKSGDYFKDLTTLMKANGGTWLEYFNSDLNSPDPKWSMTPTEARGVSYGKLLKQELAN
jgi:hypothetical protein